MCKRFEEWKNEIEEYCKDNNFDFSKVKKLSQGSNKDMLVLQYYDPNNINAKEGIGLLDETPMPVVLWVRRKGDRLEFEQTEYTKKYLA